MKRSVENSELLKVKYTYRQWNMPGYINESEGESKYKLTSKNIEPYSMSNCLISDLLFSEIKTYIKEENFWKLYIKVL